MTDLSHRAVHIYNDGTTLLGTVSPAASLVYIVRRFLALFVGYGIRINHIATDLYSSVVFRNNEFVAFAKHKIGVSVRFL